MANNFKQSLHPNGYKALEHLMLNQGNSRQKLEQHVRKQYEWIAERQEARLEQSQQPRKPYSQRIAQHRVNDQRNRYMDIIPFDSNRVILGRSDLGPSGHPGDDYINASWIEFNTDDTTTTRKRYIATQGPLSSTCGDFWRMVLEQHVKVIVCLTPEVEKGRVKCAAYWPEGNDDVKQFEQRQQQQHQQQPRQQSVQHHSFINHFLSSKRSSSDKATTFTDSINDSSPGRWLIKVQNIQPEQLDREAACILRQIQVSCYYQPPDSKEMKEMATSVVHQLHYLGWADHGIPQETETLLALVRLANQLQPTTDTPPMVVHCSAGCGRTGTFCVVDTGIEWLGKLKQQDQGTDQMAPQLIDPIFQMTDAFRKQRTTMVQTPAQYMFCYLAIWDRLKQL
ncbi:hypothetical protein [Absidia glauca]|uniref:Tyrosine-protein phosphatase domain-containing protein n=1 Tax=Absidia glauca TaxID=4829 RepID=A0A163K537_ABSGL|nr:hypothetical protein [Absidia glauca]